MQIQETIENLRKGVQKFRKDREKYNIPAEISAVEIAYNLVEFCLIKKRKLLEDEKMWFEASYYLAHGLDGTEWEDIYFNYKELVKYVNETNFLTENSCL